jgi:oligo-alginate lyase
MRLLNYCSVTLIAMTAVFSMSSTSVQASASVALPEVWPDHPRLIATEASWVELKQRMEIDPALREFSEAMIVRARVTLDLPLLERKMEGRRLLGVSREAFRRTLLRAFAFRLTGERVFVERARVDLLAVAAFDDWNPSHFLDVAEMAAAVAFGYDWLHAQLAEEDRETLRRALVRHALEHGRNGHERFRSKNNWSQVCIGGLSLAAMAIGDQEPELVASVLQAGRRDMVHGLEPYLPDGIYPEGPGYWEYGTSYQVLLIAALRTALGDDWGLMQSPGLVESATWMQWLIAPSGRFFNFADGGAGTDFSPAQFFFAKERNDPRLALAQRAHLRRLRQASSRTERFSPLAAFWWVDLDNPKTDPWPLWKTGGGTQPLAVFRSSWQDPEPRYLAVKGGGAAVNHGHMDGGSFILEWAGVRWAEDLGSQNYHTLESVGVKLWERGQNAERWQVFRVGPLSHNTLMIDHQLHNARGLASILSASEEGATIDLQPIFLPGQAKQATRRFTVSKEVIRIDDELAGLKPGVEVRWAMATRAAISVEGHVATLEHQGKRLQVQFEGAQPESLDISAPGGFNASNPGFRMLLGRSVADAEGRCAIVATLQLIE